MTKTFSYVFSDPHWMHERIREYCPEFRGHYQTREEMTEDIIRRLNEQIPPGSKVLCLGDAALNHAEALKAFSQLHFDVYWTPGNHCKTFKGNRKGWEQSRKMALQNCPNIKAIEDEFIFQVGSRRVLFQHFPWADLSDERHDVKYMEYRPRRQDYPGVSFLCHGHIHSSPSERLRDRALDCGWDAWGRAVTYEEIEEIINAQS